MWLPVDRSDVSHSLFGWFPFNEAVLPCFCIITSFTLQSCGATLCYQCETVVYWQAGSRGLKWAEVQAEQLSAASSRAEERNYGRDWGIKSPRHLVLSLFLFCSVHLTRGAGPPLVSLPVFSPMLSSNFFIIILSVWQEVDSLDTLVLTKLMFFFKSSWRTCRFLILVLPSMWNIVSVNC